MMNCTDKKGTAKQSRKLVEESTMDAANDPLVHTTNKAIILPTKKVKAAKLKKAPDAPKRFKSAFILFSAEKHKQIRAQMGEKAQSERSASISKLVSQAWKELPLDQKAKWEALARNDRTRYEVEKILYKGPWQVPNQRKTKDIDAPKRPVSAFLAFANSRRAEVKDRIPGAATNGDISRALAAMWKEAPDDVRQQYINEENEKRQKYKNVVSNWRKKKFEVSRLERQNREELARQVAAVIGANKKRATPNTTAGYYDGQFHGSVPAAMVPPTSSVRLSETNSNFGQQYISQACCFPGTALPSNEGNWAPHVDNSKLVGSTLFRQPHQPLPVYFYSNNLEAAAALSSMYASATPIYPFSKLYYGSGAGLYSHQHALKSLPSALPAFDNMFAMPQNGCCIEPIPYCHLPGASLLQAPAPKSNNGTLRTNLSAGPDPLALPQIGHFVEGPSHPWEWNSADNDDDDDDDDDDDNKSTTLSAIFDSDVSTNENGPVPMDSMMVENDDVEPSLFDMMISW